MGTHPRCVQIPNMTSHSAIEAKRSKVGTASAIITGAGNAKWGEMMKLTLLGSVAVSLWITERLHVDLVGFLDFSSCSMTDEDGLSSPL